VHNQPVRLVITTVAAENQRARIKRVALSGFLDDKMWTVVGILCYTTYLIGLGCGLFEKWNSLINTVTRLRGDRLGNLNSIRDRNIYYYYYYYLAVIGLTPGGSIMHLHTNSTQNTEGGTHITITKKVTKKKLQLQGKNWEVNWKVWAVPRLCELYPGFCLTTEEKARKNLR
jgi:hypothetical protein